MTANDKATNRPWYLAAVDVVRNNAVVRKLFLLRWAISITLTVAALAWQAYILGQDISANLSNDYVAVQQAQGPLIDDARTLVADLLNPNAVVDLDSDFAGLRERAGGTIAALGGLRAPSDRIEEAKHSYRHALEQLIGVTNRISRGDIDDMATPLHNALQRVANAGGDFNAEIAYFQGGMVPQLKAAVF